MLEIVHEWRAARLLTRGGIVALALGICLDVALHGLGAGLAQQHAGHGVILAGMVLVLLSVAFDGVSRTRTSHS